MTTAQIPWPQSRFLTKAQMAAAQIPGHSLDSWQKLTPLTYHSLDGRSSNPLQQLRFLARAYTPDFATAQIHDSDSLPGSSFSVDSRPLETPSMGENNLTTTTTPDDLQMLLSYGRFHANFGETCTEQNKRFSFPSDLFGLGKK